MMMMTNDDDNGDDDDDSGALYDRNDIDVFMLVNGNK